MRTILEKVSGSHSRNSPMSYGNQSFITAVTTFGHWSLSLARRIQFRSYNPMSKESYSSPVITRNDEINSVSSEETGSGLY